MVVGLQPLGLAEGALPVADAGKGIGFAPRIEHHEGDGHFIQVQLVNEAIARLAGQVIRLLRRAGVTDARYDSRTFAIRFTPPRTPDPAADAAFDQTVNDDAAHPSYGGGTGRADHPID